MNIRFLTVLTAAMALAWPVADSVASSESSRSGDEAVTIRYLQGHGNISTYELAAARGWLAPEVRLEPQGYSQGGPESLFALASGSVDIAGAATTAVINAIASGTEAIGVMPTSGISKAVNSKFYVLQDSNIREPDDLKGKTIAVNTLGAHLDYTVRQYLEDHDIPLQAVRLVTVPGPQLEQMLRSHQVDVAAVGNWQTTFAGKLEKDGGVRVLFTDYQVLGDIVQGFSVMKYAFIREHPEAVEKLVTQSARVADWARENPEEARQLIAELLERRGENPQLAAYWAGYGLRPGAEVIDHDIRYWLEIMKANGSLANPDLSISDIYTDLAGSAEHHEGNQP